METNPVTEQTPGRLRWSEATRRTVGIVIVILLALVAYTARIVFVPLIIGAILAYLLYPVAKLLARITRLPHGIAALLVIAAALALLVPGGILIAPLVSDQVTLLREELTAFLAHPEAAGGTMVLLPGIEVSPQDMVAEVGTAWRGLIRAALPESINLLVEGSKTLLLVIFTFFIAYYMAADADRFIGWFKRLVPAPYRPDADRLLGEINEIWAAFFRGQAVLALVVTAIITALCYAIGMPQPLLMGLLAGVLEFLVSVGHTVWLIVALVIALAKGSTYLPVSNVVFALIVIGTNLVFTKFDLNILIPAIVGSRVRLHPMVVLIGIIVGASVGGVLGIALAAPTIASLRVIGRYVYGKLFDVEEDVVVEPVVETPIEEPVKPVAGARRSRKRGEAAG